MIAYHEAGHALLAHIVGRGMTIHKVTIVPRGGALGYNLYTPTDERVLSTRDDLITRIVVLLGGRAGEEVGARRGLERRRRRSRALHGHRARDGVRLGPRRVAHDAHRARRQLRPLRGHEAPARPGAVADLRLRLRRGACGCSRRTATRSSASRPSCWSARRSTARTSPRCCTTCSAWGRSPSAGRAGPSGPHPAPAAPVCSARAPSAPSLVVVVVVARRRSRSRPSWPRRPRAPRARASRARRASPPAASVPASIRSKAAAPSAALAASTSPSSLRSCSFSCCV